MGIVMAERLHVLLDGDGLPLLDGDGLALVILGPGGDRVENVPPAPFLAPGEGGFLASLQALLPRGIIWRRDEGATLTKVLAAVADGLDRLHARLLAILDELDPRTTRMLLPEWERLAGLPDPCAGPAPTQQDRRRELVTRITWQGGQRIADLEALAASYGFTVTITRSPRFRCGHRLPARIGGPIAAHTLRVRVAAAAVTRFRAGSSRCGDRLGSIARAAALECVLRRAAAAHAVVVFNYGS
jgi:uncharacterized protein YmfQ (DUF2313 family)